MDLCFTHTVSAPLAAVEALLLDPALIDALPGAISVLASAELRELTDSGDELRRVSFFVLSPEAWPTSARRVLPRVAWTERVTWHRRAHAGSFVIEPDVPSVLQSRVRCEGRYELAPEGPRATLRRVEGVLAIDAPFVGARIEHTLGGILASWFDDEARLLAARAKAL